MRFLKTDKTIRQANAGFWKLSAGKVLTTEVFGGTLKTARGTRVFSNSIASFRLRSVFEYPLIPWQPT
jgi:hypothetical protein